METARIATIEDAGALVVLRCALMSHLGWSSGDDDDWIGSLRDRLCVGLAEGTVIGVVVTDERRPVAGGIAEIISRLPSPAVPRGQIAHISSMYTVDTHRGQGLGRSVVRLLTSEALARGFPTIELYAASPEAESLYRGERFIDRPGGKPMRYAGHDLASPPSPSVR
jgi:GNAT superfamily N-acetyltransferase